MNVRRIILLLAIVCSNEKEIYGQEYGEVKLESMGENQEYFELEDFSEHNLSFPLNLNKATKEELYQLQLNKFQVANLIGHIEQNGPLLALQELQSIEGFDLKTIQNILPLVKLGNEPFAGLKVNKLFRNAENQLLIRYSRVLEVQKGYVPITDSAYLSNPESRFLGNSMKLLMHYKFAYKDHVRFGLTAEKDPGEEFFTGSSKQGFDFYSAYLSLKPNTFVKNFIIGDYRMQFGHGLMIGSGLRSKKSADVITLTKPAQGIAPYTSSDENLFMRGAGATLKRGKFEISLFYSQKKIDADTIHSPLNGHIFVNSLYTSGLHRTPNELAKKHSLREIIYGLNSRFAGKRAELGVSVLKSNYNSFTEKSSSPYSQFTSSEKSNFSASADYNIIYNNLYLFGEIMIDQAKAFAMLNGLQAYLDRKLSFSLLYRYYPPNFNASFGNSFSENTRNSNEIGIYSGIELTPVKKFTVSLYYDLYRFPWLKYSCDAPSKGMDYHVQLNYILPNKTIAYLRIRKKSNEQNFTDSKGINATQTVDQENYRFDIAYLVSDQLRFRNRIEFVHLRSIEQGNQKGFLIYQDLIYQPPNFPIDVTGRYALFDTEGYDSRIYAYEHDVLFAYSTPAYFYRGAKVYGIFHLKIAKTVDLWVRYAQTLYANQERISSGLTEINGNKKTEMKLQVRVNF